MSTHRDLEQQARTLSRDDRARLVEVLESLHDEPLSEIETAWNQEIEARSVASVWCLAC